jgi:predicted DCC family thiol-disulfide oxidoreductase YuxK
MAFDYKTADTSTIYRAYQIMASLLDMRVLPDPLRDDLYLFFAEVRAELYQRPDFDEVAGQANTGESSR